mgnify:FL=1
MMVKTTEEALANYQLALTEFAEWYCKLHKLCDKAYGVGKWTAFNNFDKEEWGRLVDNQKELMAMEKILGISAEDGATMYYQIRDAIFSRTEEE